VAQKPVILLVDDEAKIRELVQSYLVLAGFDVLCAPNGKTALDLFAKNQVDLVLLDLMLPDLPGEEICRKIRAPAPAGYASQVPVIMLTAKVDEVNIIQGLGIGADDYVTKPFSPREVVARVKAMLRRTAEQKARAKVTLESGALVINTENRTVTKNGQEINLTTKEYNVLSLLAACPEKVFSRDEIIEQALDYDFDGFDRAIDTHIKKLRAKIGDDPKFPQYILTVYGMGYRFRSAEVDHG
jgi:DNA-binding response OmpR family regulator